MAIVITKESRILIQGMTGRLGSFHAQEMIEYGTNVVAGVTPGKKGERVHGVPQFDTVRDAVKATGANASLVFVPPPFAADAIMEAADAGIRTCICITDGIPAQDMMEVKRYLRRYKQADKMTMIGPNCAGTISPGIGFMGIMPPAIYKQGRVGVIGRSGTLGYEAASQMSVHGLGISTSVGIGGDPINGSSFLDMLKLFKDDGDTDAVMLIGEIGGPQEAEAARWAAENFDKPIVAYIAGLSAPEGRQMGHAGAIVTTQEESAAEKVKILEECGITVAPHPSAMGDTMAKVLGVSMAA